MYADILCSCLVSRPRAHYRPALECDTQNAGVEDVIADYDSPFFAILVEENLMASLEIGCPGCLRIALLGGR